MRYLFSILLTILYLSSIGQVVYQSQYNSNDTYRMAKLLQERQAKYDNNKQYNLDLQKWILQLKGKSTDYSFNSKMDSYKFELKELMDGDLSLASDKLSAIEMKINQAISEYNQNQQRIANEEAEKNSPKAHWEKGKEFFDNGLFQNSINEFKVVLQTNPDEPSTLHYIGECYAQLNQPSYAIDYFNKANSIKPLPEIEERLGWLYMQKEDNIKAIEHFNKQIELSPNKEQGYYNRGSAKSGLMDYYGAIKDYEKAVSINKDFSMAYNNLAWTYFLKKDYSKSLEFVNVALEKDKNNFIAWDTKAEVLFNLKKYSECISACTIALELNDKISNSYFIRGRAKYRIGKHDEACKDWSSAGQYGKTEAYDFISKYCN